jgi:hypothetical protein
MTNDQNPLATALGTYSPRHYLVAVFDDPGGALTALDALRNAGFPDAGAELCPGPQFLANWTDFAKHRGPVDRLLNLYPSEEQAALVEYLAAAEQGASFVTVHTTDSMVATRAQGVLKPLGGRAMRYYGDLLITDL